MSASADIAVSLIVAMAKNRVIGLNNSMPWHLPQDLKHFKKVTMGKPIIMGRKTWDSLGRPLPGRPNLVVTRQQDFAPEGAEVFGSIDAAIKAAREYAQKMGVNELMVIGGAQLYGAILPLVDRMYVTEIDLEVEGDTFFPSINASNWTEISSEPLTTLADSPLASTAKILEKKAL